MTTINAKFLDWSMGKEIKKRAQIEAQLFCQLFNAEDPDNPKEEERLSFTTGPVVPKFVNKKIKTPLSAGMYNFLRQLLP